MLAMVDELQRPSQAQKLRETKTKKKIIVHAIQLHWTYLLCTYVWLTIDLLHSAQSAPISGLTPLVLQTFCSDKLHGLV